MPDKAAYSKLHIHLGRRNLSDALEMRRRTPLDALLLFIADSGKPDFIPPMEGIEAASLDDREACLSALAKLIESMGLDEGENVWTSSSVHDAAALDGMRRQARDLMSSVRCRKAGGLLFLRAAIRNIPSMLGNGPWRPLGRKPFAGFKAVVCGAGPSLRKSLQALKGIQGETAVIAVGRAFETLRKGGVEPDLVCEIDSASHVNWKGQGGIEIPLMAPPIVSPGVAGLFKSVLWTCEGGDIDSVLAPLGLELPHVPLARSVGLYALEAALGLLGFDSAALLGVDLCLSPEGGSHAGAGASTEGDESSLFEVPGRDGGKVITSSLFNGMREAFEASPLLQSGRVFNCSEGGAQIAGAPKASLSEFASKGRPFPFKGAILKGIEKIPFDAGKAKAAIPSLEGSAKPFLDRHFEWLLLESPACRAKDPGALKELAPLGELLKAEIKNDLAFAAGSVKETVPDAHCVFDLSLKPYALSVLEKSHREFAEALAGGAFKEPARRWRLRPNFMRLPFVELLREGEPPFRLSSHISMDGVSAREMEAFVKQEAFDPAKDAAVFIAPGNWTHPLEFVRRFPKAKMLVVEPWPELFHELIRRCQLLHKLPPDAMIVGACEELPGWQAVLSRRMRRLEAGGFKLKLFKHPRTWLLPEIADLVGKLKA